MSKKVIEFLENYELLKGYTCLEESDFCYEFKVNLKDLLEEAGIEDSYVDFLDVKV
ncbi:hypothetical protein [Aquifex aeolicus]|uniref:hypothetical protein n=1 Tax=Aquifex aeolicus TaxID=63363 RepID=UPI0002F74020|nr:hypothetical protein [Aquifex aeolicus]